MTLVGQTGNLSVQTSISNFLNEEFSDNKHLDFSKTPEYRSFINYTENDNNSVFMQFGIFRHVITEADSLLQIFGLGQTFRTYLAKVNDKENFATIVLEILILIKDSDGKMDYIKEHYAEIFDEHKKEDVEPLLSYIINFTEDILFRLDEYSFKWSYIDGQ